MYRIKQNRYIAMVVDCTLIRMLIHHRIFLCWKLFYIYAFLNVLRKRESALICCSRVSPSSIFREAFEYFGNCLVVWLGCPVHVRCAAAIWLNVLCGFCEGGSLCRCSDSYPCKDRNVWGWATFVVDRSPVWTNHCLSIFSCLKSCLRLWIIFIVLFRPQPDLIISDEHQRMFFCMT